MYNGINTEIGTFEKINKFPWFDDSKFLYFQCFVSFKSRTSEQSLF